MVKLRREKKEKILNSKRVKLFTLETADFIPINDGMGFQNINKYSKQYSYY